METTGIIGVIGVCIGVIGNKRGQTPVMPKTSDASTGLSKCTAETAMMQL